jgi:RHS repeat-associated protein
VIAVTDASGNATRINTYDEYGIPGANNLGRFQYTGQAWLPSVGMYYYRARVYSPTLGRFLQTDPIGYKVGPNWYNYVGGDPINRADPTGNNYEIIVTANPLGINLGPGSSSGASSGNSSTTSGIPSACDLVCQSGPLYDYFRSLTNLGTISLPPKTGEETAGLSGTIVVRAARLAGLGIGIPADIGAIIIQNIVGFPAADATLPPYVYHRGNPPANAWDPDGPKAPGYPNHPAFTPPKAGQPTWGQSPNGAQNGWLSGDGSVWVPTGPEGSPNAHGGPHWDQQFPGGGYENRFPPQ